MITFNTLFLTPDMIDLLTQSGVSLERSLSNVYYCIDILYQLQYNMSRHPKQYSIKDAKVLNKMTKQLKDNPIFTRIDDPKIQEIPSDYLSI